MTFPTSMPAKMSTILSLSETKSLLHVFSSFTHCFSIITTHGTKVCQDLRSVSSSVPRIDTISTCLVFARTSLPRLNLLMNAIVAGQMTGASNPRSATYSEMLKTTLLRTMLGLICQRSSRRLASAFTSLPAKSTRRGSMGALVRPLTLLGLTRTLIESHLTCVI